MTKYYRFTTDLAWGVDDKKVDDELYIAYQNNDEDKFIKVFNEYYTEKYPFKLIKIFVMQGPGGNWPEVQVETTKKLTEKEFLNYIHEQWVDEDLTIEDMKEGFDLEIFD